jgi:hypothetical protein
MPKEKNAVRTNTVRTTVFETNIVRINGFVRTNFFKQILSEKMLLVQKFLRTIAAKMLVYFSTVVNYDCNIIYRVGPRTEFAAFL